MTSALRNAVAHLRALRAADGCLAASAATQGSPWAFKGSGTWTPHVRWWGAAAAPASDAAAASEAVTIDGSAVQRLHEVLRDTPDQVLRLSVDSGGCSGFQYVFTLDQKPSPDDVLIQEDGVTLAVDKVSMEFVRGATVEYADDLLSSSFRVKDNPIAEQACGCGSSFAAKMDWA